MKTNQLKTVCCPRTRKPEKKNATVNLMEKNGQIAKSVPMKEQLINWNEQMD